MLDAEIKLSPKEILDKDFKFDAKGYRPKEVDELLDLVIDDYNEYNRLVKRLERENRELKEDNASLANEVRRLKMELETREENEPSTKFTSNNVDLLKRLSNLEKIVYGKNE